jgi:large subunit ribosomal protein L18e
VRRCSAHDPSTLSPPLPPRRRHPPAPAPRAQLYAFLARRTDSGFNAIVAKRLCSSKVNRPAMGLARVARYMKFNEQKIAVVVGSVTDDVRLEGKSFPKLTIAALKFTDGARARIVKAGGECLTFDQLALLRPKGENTILLRGRKSSRTAVKHFGAPGVPNSTTRPKVRSEGRKVSKHSCSGWRRRRWRLQTLHGMRWTPGRADETSQALSDVVSPLPSSRSTLPRLPPALQFEMGRGRRKSRGFKV